MFDLKASLVTRLFRAKRKQQPQIWLTTGAGQGQVQCLEKGG